MRGRLAVGRLAVWRLWRWGIVTCSGRLGRGGTVVTALWWGRMAVALLRRRVVALWGRRAWRGAVGLLRISGLLVALGRRAWRRRAVGRLAVCAVRRFYRYDAS